MLILVLLSYHENIMRIFLLFHHGNIMRISEYHENMRIQRSVKLRAHSPLLAAGPLTYLCPVKIFYNHPLSKYFRACRQTHLTPVINICEILNNNLAESWLSHQSLVKLSGPGLERSGQKFLGPASPLWSQGRSALLFCRSHTSVRTHAHTHWCTHQRAHIL